MERVAPPPDGDERTMLVAYLDLQRATVLYKAAGLDQRQLARTTAASSLHLAGLLKHLALVEHWWFREVFLDEEPHPAQAEVDWEQDPDWEFRTAADDDPDWLRELYAEACRASNEVVAGADLDQRARRTRSNGESVTLRWILLHLLEETARHNGHADLLREAIDGSVGV